MTTMKRGHRICVSIAAGIIICAIIMHISSLFPSRNADSLTRFLRREKATLIQLAAQYPNQYTGVNYFGVSAVDTRNDHSCFSFSWSYDLLEGSSMLYYEPDGVLCYMTYSFEDTARIDGLGINGKGYIECTKLDEGWFFVESYLPT